MTTPAIEVYRDLEMRARDGTVLGADVYRPGGPGRYPAILLRTPYDKTAYPSMIGSASLHPLTAALNGFAFVIQDVRGRFRSEGEYAVDGGYDGPDGYDAVEWVASEPWCTGAVGMLGPSACALTQLAAAVEQPPSLRAILPERAGSGTTRGALLLDSILIAWIAMQAVDRLQRGLVAVEDLGMIMEAFREPARSTRTLPLDDLALLRAAGVDSFEQLVNIFLTAVPATDASRIAVPAMLTTGWYDLAPAECCTLFTDLRRSAATEQARDGARILIGPWTHTELGSMIGERFFGNHAAAGMADFNMAQRQLAFFSRWLRDDTSVGFPTATYFVMGANEWRDATDWPPPGTIQRDLFLRLRGELSWDPPPTESPDTFDYNPLDPAPSFGGRFLVLGGSPAGPFDQSRIESRPDVLVYTSPPVSEPLDLAGPVVLRLYASSSAVDTDFVAKLCDVDPGGRSHNIADGILRCRWREGPGTTPPLEPGKPYELVVDLGPVAHRFLPGHRIRLQVTSSAFPGYDRNMNTGAPPGSDTTGVVAHQTVFHDAAMASALSLPVQAGE